MKKYENELITER